MLKEADALTEAGYRVKVLCAHWAKWADNADKQLLKNRAWTCTYVDGAPSSVQYYWTRLRHGSARRLASYWQSDRLRRWRFGRVLPELEKAAIATEADLYISHYPETLSAGVVAAERNHAKIGFDIEDLYTSSANRGEFCSLYDRMVEETESNFLSRCNYLTVSSPAIGEIYQQKYEIALPETVLNVFPLALRPRAFRPTRSQEATSLYWFSQTIGEDRGLEDVVRAMALLTDTNTSLHLRGCCSSTYQAKLQGLAQSTDASPKIIFHSLESPDQMVELAAKYDIGLSPEQPHLDNRNLCYLTNKFSTYLLAGNAVIATSTDGQMSISKELGPAVFCYQPGDVDSLADQLRRWCRNREELDRARRAAWYAGSTRYNWDVEKKKFLDLVGRTLSLN